MKRFLGLILLILALFAAGLALAVENYDATVGGAVGVPANTWGPYTVEYYLDASQHNSGAGFAAGDTLDVIKLPKGSYLYGVNYQIVAGDLDTCTVDVGDTANATAYLSNQVSNSTATTDAYAIAHAAYAGGGKIRVTFDHATKKLKFYVRAIVMPFRNQ